MEGYFDPDDFDDPVKYVLTTGHGTVVNFDYLNFRESQLIPNYVKMLNGSEAMFYTMKSESVTSYPITDSLVCQIMIHMSNLKKNYTQYINYQPVIENRNLAATPENANLMSTQYFLCFVLAQMGGIYSFFMLVFGVVFTYINRQILHQKLINEIQRLSSSQNKYI